MKQDQIRYSGSQQLATLVRNPSSPKDDAVSVHSTDYFEVIICAATTAPRERSYVVAYQACHCSLYHRMVGNLSLRPSALSRAMPSASVRRTGEDRYTSTSPHAQRPISRL